MKSIFFFAIFLNSLNIYAQDFIDQRYDQQRVLRPSFSLGCFNLDSSNHDYKYGTLFDFSEGFLNLEAFEEPFKSPYLLYNNSQICNREGSQFVHFNGWDLTDRYGDTTRLNVFGEYEPYPFEDKFSSSGSLILPLPGHDSTYIVIGGNDFQYEPTYSIPAPEVISAVIFAETETGSVKIKKVIPEVFRDMFPESSNITACRHANGRDWWILCPKRFSSIVHSFILDPNGIRYVESYDSGEKLLDQSTIAPMFSPDGYYYTRTAVENFIPPSAEKKKNRCQIYKFDRCTGRIYDPINFYLPQEDTSSICQLIFDQNSRYIYAPTAKSIWQGDILADDIPSSFQQVCIADFTKIEISKYHVICAGFQGPDNKMYFFDDNNKYGVTVINHPELPGLACDAVYSAFYKPSCTGMSVGNMPYFSLGPLDGSPCDTLGLDNPLSINVTKEKNDFIVYPNPTNGLIYGEGEIIYKTLYEGNSEDLRTGIDLSDQPSGIYFIYIHEIGIKKIVKI